MGYKPMKCPHCGKKLKKSTHHWPGYPVQVECFKAKLSPEALAALKGPQ